MEWEEYHAMEEASEEAKFCAEVEQLQAKAIAAVQELFNATEAVDCDNEAKISLQKIKSEIDYLKHIATGYYEDEN